MRDDSRLNLLLTPPPPSRDGGGAGAQAWHQTVTRLLVPLGVRTFEANSGAEAVELIERHPIHLAVVDTRLPSISGMNVLQLIQRLRDRGQHITGPVFDRPAALPNQQTALSDRGAALPHQAGPVNDRSDTGGGEFRLHMQMEEKTADGSRRIEVRIDAQLPPLAKSPCGPVVILIAPRPEDQDKQLMQEALKFNAFSVLTEPVDVNLALEVMARAMKRWFSGQWPC